MSWGHVVTEKRHLGYCDLPVSQRGEYLNVSIRRNSITCLSLVLPIVQNYEKCVSRISTTNRTTLKTLISESIT